MKRTLGDGVEVGDEEVRDADRAELARLEGVFQGAPRLAVPVEKKWVGPAATSVTVHLFADGADTGKTLTLDAAGNWQGR